MVCAQALNLADSATSLHGRALTPWTGGARAILLKSWEAVFLKANQVLDYRNDQRQLCEVGLAQRKRSAIYLLAFHTERGIHFISSVMLQKKKVFRRLVNHLLTNHFNLM